MDWDEDDMLADYKANCPDAHQDLPDDYGENRIYRDIETYQMTEEKKEEVWNEKWNEDNTFWNAIGFNNENDADEWLFMTHLFITNDKTVWC
jgi:hypothetical protein